MATHETPESPTAPRPPQSRWTAGRIVLVILGSLAALLGAGLLAGGCGLLWADQTQRDDDGYLSTPTERFEASSYAIVSEPIDLVEADTEGADWLLSDSVLGDVRVQAADGDVFIGIGPTSDVEAYLEGVEHHVLTDVDYHPFRARYDARAGDAPTAPPGEQDFWATSASGEGEQTLTWNPESGDWSAVVMNADASPGIAADLSVGAEANFLIWLAIGLLVAGGILLLGGAGLIFLGARHAGAPATAVAAPGAVAAGAAATPEAAAVATAVAPAVYPVAVAGELQPDVSRWLWLVKWLLAIPHYIVLALLWIAFSILTLVAAVAILFTERFPRGIFDFNVGVLRWTWRVWFYSYWANGTDRYPPFTLGEAPDYPARLEVVYPERLNRWLPLVKWLLAIPHLILVGLFVGGWGWGVGEDWGGWGFAGLVGILVLIACVILLFTGRYPPTLFDFALGLDRWAFRVGAYVGLMTDRYPPFRLDMGPHEPKPIETAGDADTMRRAESGTPPEPPRSP
jgi:hypothetical protein